ncbi:hypothetical protein A3K73_00835 [Candidatus Pacearchaeota archaeon RBG_13_36_9]|nr:MAG: hypothetical protein A3K73_00835 [Candidatus Pacearchaeota archaeon RBG_13_36_9]
MKIQLGNISQNNGLKEEIKEARFDKSAIFLIFSNIITIFFAVYEGWSLATLMFIYWAQSVIIGVFTFIKILTLKNFSTENFRINNRQVEPTNSTKYITAFFFLFHYGMFHFGYLIFLLSLIISQKQISILIILTVLASIGIFFVNHLFSFLYHREQDSQKVKNIGTITFFPYARIIPMHLTIVFGFFLVKSAAGLVFFLVLKTIADVIMHLFEHKV